MTMEELVKEIQKTRKEMADAQVAKAAGWEEHPEVAEVAKAALELKFEHGKV